MSSPSLRGAVMSTSITSGVSTVARTVTRVRPTGIVSRWQRLPRASMYSCHALNGSTTNCSTITCWASPLRGDSINTTGVGNGAEKPIEQATSSFTVRPSRRAVPRRRDRRSRSCWSRPGGRSARRRCPRSSRGRAAALSLPWSSTMRARAPVDDRRRERHPHSALERLRQRHRVVGARPPGRRAATTRCGRRDPCRGARRRSGRAGRSAYRADAPSRSSAVTGIRWWVPPSASSCGALRSASPSGATRSSTCQTPTRTHGTSSAARRASIAGALDPPDTASVAVPRRWTATRSRPAIASAHTASGSSTICTAGDGGTPASYLRPRPCAVQRAQRASRRTSGQAPGALAEGAGASACVPGNG